MEENILLWRTRPALTKIQEMKKILTKASAMATAVAPPITTILSCESSTHVPVVMVTLMADEAFSKAHEALIIRGRGTWMHLAGGGEGV